MISTKPIMGIDQSLNGTAFCVVKGGQRLLLESVRNDGFDGFTRHDRICRRIEEIVGEFSPALIAMEDYARGCGSSSLIPLAELGGAIKLTAHRLGYAFTREARLRSDRCFVVQNQSHMKKWCLGNGATTKDSRYLLTVYEKLNIKFDNDDEADAYMHALMGCMSTAILRGEASIEDLALYQIEVLISNGVKKKKGLSMAKALKLPTQEKLQLAGF